MQMVVAFVMPGPGEWFILLMIALLFFGAKRLPEIARACGKALNEFKKGKDELLKDDPEKSDDD